MAAARRKKPTASPTRTAILEAALALAESRGWDEVRLHDVAEACGLTLAELKAEYRDQDAIANAWFGQALDAMLAGLPEDFGRMPATDRLYLVLERWLDALAPHKAVTAAMIRAKLYPSHPHHWVPMVFDLSRTVQWWRDAARLDAGSPRRQIEEIALTAIFLATLGVWMRDATPGEARTRGFLQRRLGQAAFLAGRIWRA